MGTTADKLKNILNVKKELQDKFYINPNTPLADMLPKMTSEETATLGAVNSDKDFLEFVFDENTPTEGEVVTFDTAYTFEYSVGDVPKKPLSGTSTDVTNKLANISETKEALKSKFGIADDTPLSGYPDAIDQGDSVVLGYITADKKFQGVVFDEATAYPAGEAAEFEEAYDFSDEVVRPEYLTLTAEEAGCEVWIKAAGDPTVSGLRYRTSLSGNFSPYTIGTKIKLAQVGDFVQFYNTESELSTSDSDYVTIAANGDYIASGNVMSLLNFATECTAYCFYQLFYGCTGITSLPENLLPATTLAEYCYAYMFRDCTGITSLPENLLPATTLAVHCYSGMFYGCTGLTAAPELPATNLAKGGYSHMFRECTSLTSAPELPATTLVTHCYVGMFYGCTGLTAAPELPATNLANQCYEGMFRGCTSLTSAPELPATILDSFCYTSMFRECTSLTSAPELPATTLKISCYSYMFEGCTSLTSAPELPATTLKSYCYSYMFEGCTELNYIKVGFTEWYSNATYNWLNMVPSTGTFVKPSSLPESYGTHYIPEGWTVENH